MKKNNLAIIVAASLYAPLAYCDTPAAGASPSAADPVSSISNAYSDIELRMRLAAKPDAQTCSGDTCLANQLFDAQVQALGARLAQAAYAAYPELKKHVPQFSFSVAEKNVLGTASNAAGKVVLFRGVQYLDLSDEATAFIVAREMGHVIGSHHTSNVKTKLLISALASVLFPAIGIISASSTATQASVATSVLTSAASTATSLVGSEVAMSRIKPGQLTEADDIALALLAREQLTKAQIAQALEFVPENAKSTGWEQDFHLSVRYVRQLAGEPVDETVDYEPLPEDPTPQALSTNEAPEIKLAESAAIASPVAIQATKQAASAVAAPEANTASKAEPLLSSQALNQAPSSEKPKSILITNESLAKDRAKAQPAAQQVAAKPAVNLAKKQKTTQKQAALKAVKPKKSAPSKKPAKK